MSKIWNISQNVILGPNLPCLSKYLGTTHDFQKSGDGPFFQLWQYVYSCKEIQKIHQKCVRDKRPYMGSIFIGPFEKAGGPVKTGLIEFF